MFPRIQRIVQTILVGAILLLALYGAIRLVGESASAVLANAHGSALAQPPPNTSVPLLLNYNSADYGGLNAMAGRYTMTFSLYDSLDATQPLWTETQGGVPVRVRDGQFNAVLGFSQPLTPSLFSTPELYIERQVQAAKLTDKQPRHRLTSVPYAVQTYHAQLADHAESATNADRAITADLAFALSAPDGNPPDALLVDAHGNVGIGTAAPESPFHVWTADGVVARFESTSEEAGLLLVTKEGVGHQVGIFNRKGGRFSIFTYGGEGGLDALNVLQNGNVGIGSMNPEAKLHIDSLEDALLLKPTKMRSGQSTRIKFADPDGSTGGTGPMYIEYLDDGTPDLAILGGYLGIGTTAATFTVEHPLHISNGAHVTVGGVWTNTSDRYMKENIVPVEGEAVLAKLAEIPVTTWNYQNEDVSIRHMGPMAQDFYAAFALGQDDKHISTVDAEGVALVVVQALYVRSQSLEAENAALQGRIHNLETDLAALQSIVTELLQQSTAERK